MKIRNGFVSNSSSSSFIIATGRVTNLSSFKELMEKYNISDCYLSTEHDDLRVESFDGSDVSIDKDKLSPGDTIFKFDYIGDEGDGHFCSDEDGSYYDYDIDYEDLPANVVDFIDGIVSCVDLFQMKYGAGRNG